MKEATEFYGKIKVDRETQDRKFDIETGVMGETGKGWGDWRGWLERVGEGWWEGTSNGWWRDHERGWWDMNALVTLSTQFL